MGRKAMKRCPSVGTWTALSHWWTRSAAQLAYGVSGAAMAGAKGESRRYRGGSRDATVRAECFVPVELRLGTPRSSWCKE
jgi:hypothetical protein